MTLNPCKKSGKQPIKQTRHDDYEATVAHNVASPHAPKDLPTVIRANDVAHINAQGGRVLVLDADVNDKDVRLVSPHPQGYVTGWNRPDKMTDVEAAWNVANPVG